MYKHFVGLMHELILPFNCFNYRASLEVVAKLEESEGASNQAQEKRDRMTATLPIIFINQNHSVKCNKSIELRLNADRNQNYHIRKGYQGMQSWRQVASTAFPSFPESLPPLLFRQIALISSIIKTQVATTGTISVMKYFQQFSKRFSHQIVRVSHQNHIFHNIYDRMDQRTVELDINTRRKEQKDGPKALQNEQNHQFL